VVTLEKAVNVATVVTLSIAPTVIVPPGSIVVLPKAGVPSSVTVPANTLSQDFTVTTEPLASSASVRSINIVANAFVTKTARLNFYP
jgi:hypothetical protein